MSSFIGHVTRRRLRGAAGTNFMSNSHGGTYIKSSQWMTLWVPDALRLLEDRDSIKEEWLNRAGHEAGKYSWVGLLPGNATLTAAYDELVFIHEAHKRNMAIRNETLTHVVWSPEGLAMGGGHPDTFDGKDDDKMQKALAQGLQENKTFLRKVDKGAMHFFMQHLQNFSSNYYTESSYYKT